MSCTPCALESRHFEAVNEPCWIIFGFHAETLISRLSPRRLGPPEVNVVGLPPSLLSLMDPSDFIETRRAQQPRTRPMCQLIELV